MEYNQGSTHVKIHDDNDYKVQTNVNPYSAGNTYSDNVNVPSSTDYVKNNYLRIGGVIAIGFYIILALVASIAYFYDLKRENNIYNVAFALYFAFSLWASIALAVFTAIYLFKQHEETFNRIFFRDVGLLFSLLLFIAGVAYILDSAYLFNSEYMTKIANYHAVRVLFTLICLFFCFPVYIKIKETRNLELGSGYGLSAFISVFTCFFAATLVINLYGLAKIANPDSEFGFWYLNSLHFLFFVIAMYVMFSYNDFFFGLGFTGYNLIEIIHTKDDHQTLVPVIFYFIIGLGYTGYIIYRHGRECIGISA